MSIHRSNHRASGGFTLLEVLIVMIILGALASIVVFVTVDMEESAEQAAFITSLKYLANQGYVYYIETGEYLEDSSSGQLPRGFEKYCAASEWEAPTPIGGVWDAENAGDFEGVVSAIGVHFNGSDRKDDAFMTEIDQTIDDGNLATGRFQKIAGDRYYYLIVGE